MTPDRWRRPSHAGQAGRGGTGLTDVVFDVAGYLPAGTDYTPLTPIRVLDTRDAVHGEVSSPVGQRQTVTTTLGGVGGYRPMRQRWRSTSPRSPRPVTGS